MTENVTYYLFFLSLYAPEIEFLRGYLACGILFKLCPTYVLQLSHVQYETVWCITIHCNTQTAIYDIICNKSAVSI